MVNATEIGLPGLPVWWPNDFGMAILFLLLGLAGAMAMVFLALSNWESVIGRTERINWIEGEIEEKREIAKKFTEKQDTENRQVWEKMIQDDENCLDKERSSIRKTGIFLYLVVGSIFALAFAKNAIEAILIGASWTAIVGIIGLKSKEKEVKSIKDKLAVDVAKQTNELEMALEDANKKIREVKEKLAVDVAKQTNELKKALTADANKKIEDVIADANKKIRESWEKGFRTCIDIWAKRTNRTALDIIEEIKGK